MARPLGATACILALTAAAVGAGQNAAAAATTPVGLWHLDEYQTQVAFDSSGWAHDGAISNVVQGVPGLQGSAYRFDGMSSRVVVPAEGSLNPGTADFSYGSAVRLTVKPPSLGDTYDVLRKGLSFTTGGEFKLEVVNVNGVARARCTAKDSSGRVARLTHSKSLADGVWHQLTCARTGSTWSVTVDGVVTTKALTLGAVANTAALSMGAKLGGKTGGDWYRGDLDEIYLEIG